MKCLPDKRCNLIIFVPFLVILRLIVSMKEINESSLLWSWHQLIQIEISPCSWTILKCFKVGRSIWRADSVCENSVSIYLPLPRDFGLACECKINECLSVIWMRGEAKNYMEAQATDKMFISFNMLLIGSHLAFFFVGFITIVWNRYSHFL